jgi:DNA-directed RNA polymerase sigma subunit (sigma70/sigma32)
VVRLGNAHRREMFMPDVVDARLATTSDRLMQRDEVRSLLSRLDPRERAVLAAHFGITGAEPASYDQLRSRFGLSVQRLRQIERKALAKLRASASDPSPGGRR